jgi:hypothetical protein
MARVRKKVVIVLTFIALVSALALVIYTSLGHGPALPNPNGYDDFVKAGKMVTTTLDGHGDLGDYRELGLESLRAFAATNADALKIARVGLEHQCRVPVKNSQEWFRAHLGEMVTFKDLTRVFLLAGRLAQIEGRTNDAVTAYLELIRFAHESTRGGMILETAAARALEGLGTEGLERVQDSLDAAQNRRIAEVLEELDARRESWGDYFGRDLRYELRSEFRNVLSLDSWRTRQHFKAKYYQAELRRRHAMLAFAARAYELEAGEKPKSLTNLVPVYLKAIPQDPLTRTNLTL